MKPYLCYNSNGNFFATLLNFITLSLQEENSRNTIEFQKKLLNRRRKRQTSNNVNDSPENNQKAIEIAVFVDDDLYYKTKKANSGDPIEAIQNLVFAYLNSVIFSLRYIIFDQSRLISL